MRKSKCTRVLKVFGDQTRWNIIAELLHAPRTVGELTQKLKVSQYNISKHIRKLREAGIVETQRKGQFMKCSVKSHLQNRRKKSELDLGCCKLRF
jgi:DNA-binding transcriptional ArsR family regulator